MAGGVGGSGAGDGCHPAAGLPGGPPAAAGAVGGSGSLTAQPQADGGPGLASAGVVAAVVALVGQAGIGEGQPRRRERSQDGVPPTPLSWPHRCGRAWQQHLGAQGAVLQGAAAWGTGLRAGAAPPGTTPPPPHCCARWGGQGDKPQRGRGVVGGDNGSGRG